MKSGIHPSYETAKITCACGRVTETRSTVGEIHVEICSHCHPFFTGRQKLVDTAGRVERFMAKYGDRAGGAPAHAEEAGEAAPAGAPVTAEAAPAEAEAPADATEEAPAAGDTPEEAPVAEADDDAAEESAADEAEEETGS